MGERRLHRTRPADCACGLGYTTVLDREFNSVTAENAMKWDAVEPTRGSFNWAAADRLVAHASAHNQGVRGHTLAWYAQLPSWLKNGNF
ncbi:endo-1,4-beta-xylanase [Streptomyces sp. NPDC059340]|uniref:endo-1,4-beta-xylanase n=1 Tax=Streptomyces sp. NPDC059340 TaxID=3346806 RepID=UPI00368DCC5A